MIMGAGIWNLVQVERFIAHVLRGWERCKFGKLRPGLAPADINEGRAGRGKPVRFAERNY